MKPHETDGIPQRSLKFFRDLQSVNPPKDAPAKLVRQCSSQTLAMRVSLKAAGLKQLACARMLGINETYLSRLIARTHNSSGELPEWFVPAFCWATGSSLLAQQIAKEHDDRDEECERVVEQRMAYALQVAA